MDIRQMHVQQLFEQGATFLQAGRPSEALSRFQAAGELAPAQPKLMLFTGAALHDLKRYDEAVACYDLALEGDPHLGEAHNNRGNSLMALGRFSEAAESYARAVSELPDSPVPLAARATALQAVGMVSEAEAACRRAVALDPGFAAAHWNLALSLLLQGRYEEGWREYEWRWQKPDFTSPVRHPGIPLWDGTPLAGKSILLHAEQGFGDAIQFARYVPLVAQLGGAVILECHPQLLSLFQSLEGVGAVVPFGAPVPHCHYQCPLLSLPRIFSTSIQTVPSQCPYLVAAQEYRRKWSELISAVTTTEFRVGLVWAGKSYPDPLRSCRLEQFAGISDGEVTFFSLQLGDGCEQAMSPPIGMKLIDLTEQIADFADTAALIEHLDLVISIDTAVAHLAGALGKKTLVMLPFAPDWRWLTDRSDSPWYPTMHLYRQDTAGDWTPVILRIASALSSVLQKNKAP